MVIKVSFLIAGVRGSNFGYWQGFWVSSWVTGVECLSWGRLVCRGFLFVSCWVNDGGLDRLRVFLVFVTKGV